jgi:hypothetical protein
MTKYAILGYSTINVGDDIQSFVTSTLLNISYIVNRDDYDIIYDFNTGEKVILDEKIFLIMNGWFMHNSDWKTGNGHIKFPIKHVMITPIYISTCLSGDVPLLYKDECIKHYKHYSPILCRDLTTVNLLHNKGVHADFFGCVTQLLDISNVPDNDDFKRIYLNSIIYVDCPKLWEKRNTHEKNFYFEHYIDKLQDMKPKNRIEFAMNLLSKYKHAKKIYSSRLHAFLPCKAMGLDVEYVGIMDYRVKDLCTQVDKLKLTESFFSFINYRINIL